MNCWALLTSFFFVRFCLLACVLEDEVSIELRKVRTASGQTISSDILTSACTCNDLNTHSFTHLFWARLCRDRMTHGFYDAQHSHACIESEIDTVSLTLSLYPPGRLHKWHCVLWRFYLTVVAWRERDVLSHSDPTTQIWEKKQNVRLLLPQRESQPWYLKLDKKQTAVYPAYHYLLPNS